MKGIVLGFDEKAGVSAPSSARSARKLALRIAVVAGIAFPLASCGDSGPSRSEAAAAMTNEAKSELGGFYSNPKFKINVDDLKCTQSGDGIYNCQVLMTAVGPGGSKQSTVSVQFTKLGGEWRAKAMRG